MVGRLGEWEGEQRVVTRGARGAVGLKGQPGECRIGLRGRWM